MMRLPIILTVLAILLWPLGAAAGFADMMRYVFVPMLGAPVITIIDSRDDSVAGSVEAGLVPNQLDASGDLAKLVAIDGLTRRVSVIALAGGAPVLLPLDFVPLRLAVSGDGVKAVAVNPASGRVAVVDLAATKVVGQWDGLAPFNDFLLNTDGRTLFAAPNGRDGIAIIDLAAGRVTGVIANVPVTAALTRAPSNRVAYAKAAGAGGVTVLDLKALQPAGVIASGSGLAKAYASATGITLVLPDSQDRQVTFASASSLKTKAVLSGAAGMVGVYSGWFDTVAFIPSTAERAVLVYDQQMLERGRDIMLGGIPGRGTVTPDGRKLYLPLTDMDQLAVINAENRRLTGTIRLPGRANVALMGRTFGICH